MRRLLFLIFLVSTAHAATGVRLILGLTDTADTKWDGSAAAQGARISSIEPWRFENADAIDRASWRLSTHPIRLFGGGRAGRPPVVANGVIVWLDGESEDAQLNVSTAQGDFTVRLREIPYGKAAQALGGRVMADRVPPASRITATPAEQDYPAAATKNGEIWIAYLEFRHHREHDRLRANFVQPPASFDDLRAPPGGDQILARKYANGAWSDPVAITPPGGDLFRPAIAIDGSGRPWVFWSANENGTFDLWARAIENGQPGRTVRLTNTPGSDIDPAAVTDAKGAVWVAWQSWRDGRAAIFAAEQQGDGFTKPAAVSSSPANEWNPAIAADAGGRVTVAWDSYRHGNYDVYARTAAAPARWGKEFAVAASARYEAYPSLAYDRDGRLWAAWEEGAEQWGKDFGAYETTGIALYQGRAVRLAGFDRGGARIEPAADPGAAMPGVPVQRIDGGGRQNDSDAWLKLDPENARTRAASRPAANVRAPKNSLPRLTADPSGRLWLAFRSAHPMWWNPIGTVWSEYVVTCEASGCTGPIFLPHSDNLLDNRPALAVARPGEMMVIGSSDSRRQFHLSERRGRGEVVPDPYNNDLYASVVVFPPGAPVASKPASAPAAAAADRAEQSTIAMMRNFRLRSREGELRLIRGEFHRHSEISGDGGNDGAILDQWRYMLDAGGMDWVGCCDHDNGGGREYSWWISQKLTDIFYTPGRFVPLFSYERSVPYPEGHRNVVFANRGIRPLPRLPKVSDQAPGHAPDTQMFYAYLRKFDGIVASHTSGTNMGTDWRDNDPAVEPVVEIYQGDRQNYEMPGAPRSNSEADSIGGWRPKGFVNLALEMGYKMGFQASSDHISTHMSYCNIYAKSATREALMDAFKKRHVYGATDNILAEVTSGDHMMGDAFETALAPELRVRLTGTAAFAKIHVVKDNKYAYSIEPNQREVAFTWRDTAAQPGKTSYYYVRGEQQAGEIVWVSPMWITYK